MASKVGTVEESGEECTVVFALIVTVWVRGGGGGDATPFPLILAGSVTMYAKTTMHCSSDSFMIETYCRYAICGKTKQKAYGTDSFHDGGTGEHSFLHLAVVPVLFISTAWTVPLPSFGSKNRTDIINWENKLHWIMLINLLGDALDGYRFWWDGKATPDKRTIDTKIPD